MRIYQYKASTFMICVVASLQACVLPFLSATAGDKLNPEKIEKLTGLAGKCDEKKDIFTVKLPRKDLKVVANGVKITPPFGLTARAAFTRTGEKVMAMGDIVLTENQVNPVMSAALDNGLEVTALHNHFF